MNSSPPSPPPRWLERLLQGYERHVLRVNTDMTISVKITRLNMARVSPVRNWRIKGNVFCVLSGSSADHRTWEIAIPTADASTVRYVLSHFQPRAM